jgi:hypothetical protein
MATSICATPFKLAAARFTLLNACGVPVNGASSSISVTGNMIEVAETRTWEDQEEFYTKNGLGQFCTTAATPPILKYIDVTVTLCATDPQLVNFLTNNTLVTDDSTVPQVIGYRDDDLASFNMGGVAVEGWTLLSGKTACSTGFQYGYVLYPFGIQGQIQDQTFGNNTVNLVVKFRTSDNSGWGVGPYNVNISNAPTLTTGQPMPLLTTVGAAQQRDWHLTALAPPIGACGAIPLVNTLPTLTTVARLVTLTFPTPANLPAIINWGDGTADTTVTTGTNVTHTYTAAGTYAVTYNPTGIGSTAPWTGNTPVLT